VRVSDCAQGLHPRSFIRMRTVVNAMGRFRPGGDPADLLDVLQVAQLLRCGRTTVFRLIRDGELPSIKPGRSRLVTRADVDAYVERARSTADR
jgi:excisionase family DNA binding protein